MTKHRLSCFFFVRDACYFFRYFSQSFFISTCWLVTSLLSPVIYTPSLPLFPPSLRYRSVRGLAPPPFTALVTSTASTLHGAFKGPATLPSS